MAVIDPVTITEMDLIEAQHAASDKAQSYASHVHTKKLFEERGKDMLAAIKLKFKDSSDKMSDAEAETRARASEEWKNFRKEAMKHLIEAGRAQIAYNEADRRWDTIRSILSLKKAEIGRI